MILTSLIDTLFRNWFSMFIAWLTIKHWDSLHWFFKIILSFNIAYAAIGIIIAIVTHIIMYSEVKNRNKYN